MLDFYGVLIIGIVLAGIGGEIFVRGTVGLARWSRISPGIIGATVAAFATSSPELSVSISSALVGKPQIALGDALGSNVVNIALILGAALVISGIRSPRAGVKRDFPVALLVPIVTGVQVLGAQRLWIAVAYCMLGLLLLIAAGRFVVSGARGIASHFAVGEFVIVAKLRGHDEVGLGILLGSNIFNGLFIIPLAATIHPIAVGWHEVFTALIFGVVALVCSYPSATGFIERRRGALLLVLYGAYLTTVLQLAGA